MRYERIKWAIFGLLWVVTPVASALALTEATLLSTLNERLDARISLLSVSDSDLDALDVVVRPGTTLGTVQVPDFAFTVERGAGGAYLQVTSRRPVREPIIEFEVEVSWPAGRIVRHYTLIIDPE